MTKTVKMEYRHTAAIIIATIILSVPGALAINAKGNRTQESWDERAQRLKSDYIFMEGMRVNSQPSRPEDYFFLMRRAEMLNPDDADIAAEVGYYEWAISADSAMHQRGIAKLKRHFEEFPEDYFWSSLYATAKRREFDTKEVVRVGTILDSLFPDKTEHSLQLADDLGALAAAGDTSALAHSLAILNRIELGVGKEPWLISRKVRVYSAVRDTVSIMREVADMLSASPGSSTNNLLAGSINAFFNRPDSAIYYYNRACSLDSANGEAFYTRAEFFREIGDSAAYDREVFNSLKLTSLEVDTKLQLLTGYVKELYSDTTTAQRSRINDLFNVLMEQHPHEAKIHSIYGTYLAVTNRLPEAAEQFQYTVDIDPSDMDAWRMLISARIQSEDNGGVIDAAQRARSLFPDEYWWYLTESIAYLQSGRNQEAKEVINKALNRKGMDQAGLSPLYSSLGDIYHSDGMIDSAMTYYERAIELDPSNFLAMNNAAYYLAVAGKDLDKAEGLAATAVKGDPENTSYLDTYAWVYFKKADYKEAKRIIDKTLEECEKAGLLSADVLEHAGDIYFMSGEPTKALEFWEKASELNPDNELLKRKVKHKTYFYE